MSHRCQFFALPVGVRLLNTFMNEVLTDLPGSFGNLSRTKVAADFLGLILSQPEYNPFCRFPTLLVHKDFCHSWE